jgi:hypothetical protein
MVGWNNTGGGIPILTFTVHWEQYGSLTAWAGYCEEKSTNAPIITTLWHYVRSKSEFEWDHIITNSDVFKPANE